MKAFLTAGIIDGKMVTLKDPTSDLVEHREFVRKLTDKGGKMKHGKGYKQVSEAVVVHTDKGLVMRRVF